MSATHALELDAGLTGLNLKLSQAQKNSLLNYATVLLRWNRQYNLIGRSTEQILIQRHLLDSLIILPVIEAAGVGSHFKPKTEKKAEPQRWLDVGSGAGLPGIPLAIARPDVAVTLLDSNSKKTRFLLQAAAELELPNVDVVHTRVEDFKPTDLYNGLLSRAWAAIPDGLRQTAHLGASGAYWWFMKGHVPEQELLGVPKQFTLTRQVALPANGEARHLLEFIA